MTDLGVASVAGITVICYLGGMIGKAAGLPGKWVPCAVGILGGALGVAGMHLMPAFPASDAITALAVGIVSGLAATGADQLYKQVRGL